MTSACRRHALVVCALLAGASPVFAQDADPAALLEEFIHYTNIAQPELAAGYAEQLLRSSISDAELALILDEGRVRNDRFESAVGRAHRVPELEAIAAELDRRVMEGRLDLARDPERIAEAISMLTGTQRQKLHGRLLLQAAGEYAVPSLLQIVVAGGNERLRSAAGDMLVSIGRLAVMPVCTALPELDSRTQRFACQILNEIGLPEAAPHLLELAQDESAAVTTREAAGRAFADLTRGRAGGGLSQLYYELAMRYFNEQESLIAYLFEPTNNVWTYDSFHGLEATPVPTAIFSEIMAMNTTSKVLEVDSGNGAALSLFVAANLRRENELPQGARDPIYGENPYSPAFYATVFGPQVCLDVLAIGIDRVDTPLVRDAIAALAETTGGANLFSAASGRQPLLEALRYPDRRVQYEAALTLGRALPVQRFIGDAHVVPLLASAVRTGDKSFAAVIAEEQEDLGPTAERLEQLSFTIIAQGRDFAAIRAELGAAVGIDLIVVRFSTADEAILTVDDLAAYSRTAAAPIVIIARPEEMALLRPEFRDNIRIKVSRAGVSPAEFAEAVNEVMLRAAGGRMTEADAEAYAIEAIMTLRDIAISGTTAYAISDAESALLQALDVRTGALRLSVADILALMDSPSAQRKLFDAALAATGEERIDLLDRVAESVKRFGDRSEARHVAELRNLIMSSSGREAEAAARVHGALDRPTGSAIDLIP